MTLSKCPRCNVEGNELPDIQKGKFNDFDFYQCPKCRGIYLKKIKESK